MKEKSLVKKAFSIILSVILMVSVTLPVLAAAVKLTDIAGNQYEKTIQKWVDSGYVEGYPDGTFKPNKLITRAEFMALVNKSFKMAGTAEPKFSDVKKTDWFYGEVSKAVKAGYMEGSNGKMYPKNNISRQELAVVISRLGKLDTKVDTAVMNKLKDAGSIPGWSKGAVSAALSKKLFDGFVTAEFKASQYVSRVEAVAVLDRLMTELSATIDIPEDKVAGGPAKIPGGGAGNGNGGGNGGGNGDDNGGGETHNPTLAITGLSIVNATTFTFNCNAAGATIKWNGKKLSAQTASGANTITVPLMVSGENNTLEIEKPGYVKYTNNKVVWNDPLTYSVSHLSPWVDDRTAPNTWGIGEDNWITYSTKTEPANQWYAWQGKKTTTNNAVTDNWKVETQFELTGDLLGRDNVRTSIWLNVENEYGDTVDWSILQFKIDKATKTKGWQYWNESGAGAWVDINADIPTTPGVYKLAIYYADGKVTGYINGIEVFKYAKSESKLTSVKEVIYNSYSFGNSYTVKWKVPIVSYVDKYPVGARFISTNAQLAAAILAQADGQTWIIGAGTYDLNAGFAITKDITLIGVGEVIMVADEAPVDRNEVSTYRGKNPVILINNANVTIKNITVKATNMKDYTPVDGITACGNSNVTLEGVTITDIMNMGVYNGMQYGRGYTGDTGTNTTIINSKFSNFNKNGVHFYGAGTTGNIDNSSFIGTYQTVGSAAQNGVVFQDGATGSVKNSRFESLCYTSPDPSATGVLSYGAGSNVTVTDNTFTNVQTPVSQEAGGVATESGSTISQKADGISLNKTATIIKVGATETLVATVLPANAANKNVTWKSDSAAATVDSAGVVKGVSPGTAVITATAQDGGKTATCTVTVTLIDISYFTGIGFKRSNSPIVESAGDLSVSQEIKSDGSVGITVSSPAKSYVDSGFVMAAGTLGELGSIEVQGTGDYGLNLYFDLDGNGFFQWNDNGTYVDVGGDRYALYEEANGSTISINGSSKFGLQKPQDGEKYVNTLDELKAKFPANTPVGIWVGVTRGGSEPAETISADIRSVNVTHITPPDLLTLTAQGLATWDNGTVFRGVDVEFSLGDNFTSMKNIASMVVDLYAGGLKLATNTARMTEWQKLYPAAKQCSTPFIAINGSFDTANDVWTYGSWEPRPDVVPTKAVITITDVFGKVYTAETGALTETAGLTWNALLNTPDIAVTVLSSTRSNSVDTTNNTISNFGWFAVKFDSPLDLSAGSKGNLAINYEFSTDNGATWEQAKKADGTVFFKDKAWTGYLNREDGTKYPGANSGDIIPAGVIIDSNETKVGERAANAYSAIIAADATVMVRTVLNITDNYGIKLAPITLDPVTFINGVPDNMGIDIYDKQK